MLLGDETGSFDVAGTFAVREHPESVALGDFDSDGNLDIITPMGTSPNSIAVGDLDGDGNLDIVTANQKGDTVSVLLNMTRNDNE